VFPRADKLRPVSLVGNLLDLHPMYGHQVNIQGFFSSWETWPASAKNRPALFDDLGFEQRDCWNAG